MVYLGTTGMNATSAGKLAAVASSLIQEKRSALNNLKLFSTEAALLNSDRFFQTEVGSNPDLLDKISEYSNDIAELQGFIGWCNEGEKALESERNRVTYMSLPQWESLMGLAPIEKTPMVEMPAEPTMDDIMAKMSVKDLASYIALQSKCAFFGSYIKEHFTGALNDMYAAVDRPYETHFDGANSIIKCRKVSIAPAKVQDIFNSYQKEYQETQSQFNHMKSDLERKLSERKIEVFKRREQLVQEHDEAAQAESTNRRLRNVEFARWKEEELQRVLKLKIVIPERYQELYSKLQNLGKK